MHDADRLVQRARTVAVLLLLVLFVWVAWSAGSFRVGASLFPQLMGVAGALLCVLELGRQWLTRHRGAGASSAAGEPAISTADLTLDAEERNWAGWRRALALFGWLAAWFGLTALLGLPLATLVWVPALLVGRFRSDWRVALAIAVGLVGLMVALRWALAMQWPQGWVPLPF
jgi:hypothetical protein